MADDTLREAALVYHRLPKPGKLEVTATKPLANQRDLALAYSPGVAAACEAIAEDPIEAWSVTARGNLVAVISNGTAVLGLGAIGPLAAKPVMEGKAVLFKKFAGVDVFDIEVAETTNTARRSSWRRPSTTACAWSARRWTRSSWSPRAPARRRWPA
jgi:malate dehydrogenase (oxaloacetate-decarboxylating)(NADP+)